MYDSEPHNNSQHLPFPSVADHVVSLHCVIARTSFDAVCECMTLFAGVPHNPFIERRTAACYSTIHLVYSTIYTLYYIARYLFCNLNRYISFLTYCAMIKMETASYRLHARVAVCLPGAIVVHACFCNA